MRLVMGHKVEWRARWWRVAAAAYHPSTSLRKEGRCACCQLVETMSSYNMGALGGSVRRIFRAADAQQMVQEGAGARTL